MTKSLYITLLSFGLSLVGLSLPSQAQESAPSLLNVIPPAPLRQH